ncbi:N-6 DNA methylase [Methanolapillus millepedarum]|uniref:site-specific DNA-methyltransferase (adenine-specific) n=1 Tax=Methanolapillus millepedarum TaxID=3028296 RepID=A0AA96V5C6_9EURY|nr:hypothetical protein MsAc7_17290 [Methanosarcinaceae archaeon Ac7]
MEDFQKTKEFEKIFNKLRDRNSGWKIWDDFVTMSAIAISNRVDSEQSGKRETEYMRIVKQYSAEDLNRFAELFAITVLAFESDPNQDFLGALYMQLELSNVQTGQFFTPYHICELAAKLNTKGIENERVPISVLEPAAGAGGMIIAFANAVREKGINYQDAVFFEAWDIDKTVAMMCYIQMSLLGMTGIVVVGNTLSKEVYEKWFTPMIFTNHWHFRRFVTGILDDCNSKPDFETPVLEPKSISEPPLPVEIKQESHRLIIKSIFDFQ